MRSCKTASALARRELAKRPPPPAQVELCMRNLPRENTEGIVRALLAPHCDRLSIKIPLDRESQEPRGIAFVKVDAAEAEAVKIAVHQSQLNSEIVIEDALNKSRTIKPAGRPPGRLAKLDAVYEAKMRNRTLANAQTAAEVLSFFKSENFTSGNVSNALHRLGRLSCRSLGLSEEPLLRELVDRATQSIEHDPVHWLSKGLSNVVWAVCRIGLDAPDLFRAVEKVAVQKMHHFSPQELSNVSWAFAKAGFPSPPLFDAVASAAPKKIEHFGQADLSLIAWAFATAGVSQKPQLFDAVAAEALRKIGKFNSHSLANLIWAFAYAKVEAPWLFEAAATEKISQMSKAQCERTLFHSTLAEDVGPIKRENLVAIAAESMVALRPQELTKMCWAYATSGSNAPALFKAVADEAPRQIEAFKPQELASIVWAFAKAGVEAPFMFEAVAYEASKKVSTFGPQDLANTAYSATGVEAPLLFEAVAAESVEKIDTFDSQEVTARTYAKAGVEAPLLFEAVKASTKIAAFGPRELANTVWAYSTAGVAAPALFETVAAESVKKIATFNSQELANIVWAYSTMRVSAPALFEAVAAEAPKKIATFDPQNLANTVWAYSTMGFEAPLLFEAVAAEAKKAPTDNRELLATILWVYSKADPPSAETAFTRAELSSILWAYSDVRAEAPPRWAEVFEKTKVAASARSKLQTFPPHHLAATAKAFAKARVDASAFFDAVAAEALKKIEAFAPRDLSSIAWSFSTAFRKEAFRKNWPLYEAVSAEASKNIKAFEAPDLAGIAWGFSRAGAAHRTLFDAISGEAPKKIAAFTPKELSDTAGAYAAGGVEAPSLFAAVGSEALEKITAFTPQDLSSTAWAFSILQVEAFSLLDAIAAQLETKVGECDGRALAQLFQVHAYLCLEAPRHRLAALLGRHRARLRIAYLAGEEEPTQSKRNVSASLKRMGWAHEFEHVTVEGFRIGMAQPASKLAFEFDAEFDFLGGSRVLDGETKAKQRMLKKLGWTIARVPFFEWDRLAGIARDEYLTGKMDGSKG